MYELIFADEKSVIEPRPYRSILKRVTEEQHKAVENFVDSMMLEDDMFLPGEVNDPGMQHTWNRIAARAVDPQATLPPVKDYLMKLISKPNYHDPERFERCVDKLVELFPIPVEEKKEKEEDNPVAM